MKRDIHSSEFNSLDRLIGEFTKGDLVLIGGRPTVDLAQVLIGLAIAFSKKAPVLYFTTCESHSNLIDHVISSLIKIPVDQFVREHPAFDDTRTIASFLFPKPLNNILIHDSCSNPIEALKHLRQQFINRYELKFIIVDSLQKLCHPQDEIKFVRKIKKLAKDFGIVAIVATEISESEIN